MNISSEQFGVLNKIGAPIVNTHLAEQAAILLPPRCAKFTLSEWKLHDEQHAKNTKVQKQLADRILAESARIRDETDERAKLMRATSDYRLKERIGDVQYNEQELLIHRKEICLELEAFDVYKKRLQDCLASLSANSMAACRKCMTLREGRVGIDLVVDAVERALQDEMDTLVGGQNMLKVLLEQLNEQMRRLRSARYLLDQDLQYKKQAINIDISNLDLKPTNTSLFIYESQTTLDPSNISSDEYNAYSNENIQQAAREVNSSRPMRNYIDTILKQVIDDLWNAYHKCNHEFRERILATRQAKSKLEDMHKETSQKICDMQNNILELKKALGEKEGYVGLVHTRLGCRAQRTAAELVRDSAGQALKYEAEMLRFSVKQLQQMLQEANASLRYLLQTQIQLEEDINVKMNTLKIDEADCMSLRDTMSYHAY